MNSIEQQLQHAVQLHEAGDSLSAENSIRQILATHPHYAAAWEHLGIAKAAQKAFDEAIECYQRVLSIDPNHASALNNLGNAYRNMGRLQEAIACFDRALAIDPHFLAVQTNKAVTLALAGDIRAALRHFEEILQHDPGNADIHKCVGIARLMIGDFARGWPEYEWRYKANDPALPPIQPLWDGAALYGKTILLICEPGLGDDIMFIRYAAWLKEHYGCRILFAGRPRLRELLGACKGIDQWIEEPPPHPLPHFDVFAPLMRVPAVLGHTLNDAPGGVPYLTADASLVDQWKRRLSEFKGRKIGIHWRVGHQQGTAGVRNVPLAEFARLAQLPDVRLFSLQKGPGADEVQKIPEIIDLGPELDERTGAFVETAAVLKNLDLLITSDSAIGHVAGALGVPVWLVLCKPSEWRWGQTGATTVWYPTMRLFRQATTGDWSSALNRVVQALTS